MQLRSGRFAALFTMGVLSTAMALAQTVNPDQPDWTEAEVPPPPVFQTSKLVSVDVDAFGSLRYGVDPATLGIGRDGVVRYVVVVQSPSGAMTAMYEGLRCGTAEYKLYARFNDGHWTPVASREWRSVFESSRVKHPLAIARQGGCDGKAPPSSVREMRRQLENPGPVRNSG